MTPDRPGLRTAKARTMQAAQRLSEIQSIQDQLRSLDNPITVSADRGAWERGEPLMPTVDFTALSTVNSGAAPLLAGEVLYHLRTALDYLAYNLAWLSSGSEQLNTAFPILDKEKDWVRACKSRLKGVRHSRLETIRSYQPFAGCEWTRDLRDLSNVDKHRVVVDIAKGSVFEMHYHRESVQPHPTEPDRVIINTGPQDVGLILDDGRQVVQVLSQLIGRVARLLADLQVDFGEQDELKIATDHS